MDDKIVLKLHPTEIAVLQAAARIFAGYLSTGKVEPGNREDLLSESVTNALALAAEVESRVQCEDELM